MEAVRAFNNELSSIYEGRPPVSRAKMASVTKSAIKAIKFYKHVVQSVEKFITKCKPEYKVPGLYVIDSIVRQSRHQFGQDKDMFSARFSRNIVMTFQSLFKCPPDEKSKIIRVLNLWQKNYVFPSEIIQVLLDLAEDPANSDLISAAESCVEKLYGPSKADSKVTPQKSAITEKPNNMPPSQNEMLNTVNQLLQQTNEPQTIGQQQQQIQQLQLLQQQLLQQTQIMQQDQQQEPVIDSNLLSQIQVLTNQLLSKPAATTEPECEPAASEPQPGFKKLLEFDYGESDDDEDMLIEHADCLLSAHLS